MVKRPGDPHLISKPGVQRETDLFFAPQDLHRTPHYISLCKSHTKFLSFLRKLIHAVANINVWHEKPESKKDSYVDFRLPSKQLVYRRTYA